jgi:hypothetical protein
MLRKLRDARAKRRKGRGQGRIWGLRPPWRARLSLAASPFYRRENASVIPGKPRARGARRSIWNCILRLRTAATAKAIKWQTLPLCHLSRRRHLRQPVKLDAPSALMPNAAKRSATAPWPWFADRALGCKTLSRRFPPFVYRASRARARARVQFTPCHNAATGKLSRTWRRARCRAVGFNRQRLLEPNANIPPAEAEERYYAILNEQKLAA